jgi:hypothetical protein
MERRVTASARKVHAVFGPADAENKSIGPKSACGFRVSRCGKQKHRPEKHVAGLNPAIPFSDQLMRK